MCFYYNRETGIKFLHYLPLPNPSPVEGGASTFIIKHPPSLLGEGGRGDEVMLYLYFYPK
jgi:hypothetical protein